MKEFKLNSQYKPLGDQPKAIDALVDGINNNVVTIGYKYLNFSFN